MTIEMYLVGGFVRDHLLGTPSKDVDFSVVAPSFDDMEAWLVDNGFEIFLSTPQYYTTRARGPKGFTFAGFDFGSMTFDFVWARKDGTYTDGRHPDFVTPGTLLDDLSRRDFTMNAIAMDKSGNIIDPFGGHADMEQRNLMAVGTAKTRFEEDGLRMLRALRFSVTKDMFIHPNVRNAFDSALLRGVSAERMREEIHKMFAFDQVKAWDTLNNHWSITLAVMDAGVNFIPTLKKV